MQPADRDPDTAGGAAPGPDPDEDQLVRKLLAELTLEEKAALTGGRDVWHLPAVPRLGIAALKMSDGPSGVRGAYHGIRQSMAFPCGMAVGATWDVELVHRYGRALAEESRAKGAHVLLGPTINIVRTPLAGRTFECFSEDPLLTSRLAVAYIRGVQGEGVACCVKHYACNDQEQDRFTVSAEVDARTLREVHLPGFEASVREAGVWSIMGAYNKVDGTYACEHPELLTGVLRDEWGFDGAVISDWLATHSTVPAATAGLDIEMPGPPAFYGRKLAEAVAQGELEEAVLDGQVANILRLLARTGGLSAPADGGTSDPAGQDAAEPQDVAGGGGGAGREEAPDDPGRRAVARELAVAGTVLLRNDGLLPLPGRVEGTSGSDRIGRERSLARLAVIGPNSRQLTVGGGGSSLVTPLRRVSFAAELAGRLPDGVEVVHEPGISLDNGEPPLDPLLLSGAFAVDYFADPAFQGDVAAREHLAEGRLVNMGRPVPELSHKEFSLRASATFTADVSGPWRLGLAGLGDCRLLLDGDELVANDGSGEGEFFFGMGAGAVTAEVGLVAGEPHDLTVELAVRAEARLPVSGFEVTAARPTPSDARERARQAAADADAVVLVVGSNQQWESEGHDRTTLALPGDQDAFVREILAANPTTVVVVNAGAPVTLPWAEDAAALMQVWYPGEEGAAAVADILTGATGPGGRLPVSVPHQVEDTSAHGFYPGDGGTVHYGEGLSVGYRHHDTNGIEPAFPFGHGLTYTAFGYGMPTDQGVDADGGHRVSLAVANTGDRPGTEVVQVYLSAPESTVARPARVLAAFTKVDLAAGESRQVDLVLDPRAFSYWDESTVSWIDEPGRYEAAIGSSSRDLRQSITLTR